MRVLRSGSSRSGSSRWREDRGDITILAAGIVLVLFLAIGLVVDGSGLMESRDDARAAAEQAARAAGQQVLATSVMDGAGTPIDVEQARRAATRAAATRGYTVDVRVADGVLTVTADGTYRTVFWAMVGVRDVGVRGEARIRLVDSAT